MPEHLFKVWEEIAADLKDRYVMLFLDYDGTLTPITERPEMAKLTSEVRDILRELARLAGIKIAVISGRALSDLKKRVRIPGLIYVGNHGLELHSPKIRYVHPAAMEFKQLLQKIAVRLKKNYESFPGIIVENKIFTLSIHYRNLSPGKVDSAK